MPDTVMEIGDVVACSACAEDLVMQEYTFFNGNKKIEYLHVNGFCRVTGATTGRPFEPLPEQVVSELLDLDEMDRMLA